MAGRGVEIVAANVDAVAVSVQWRTRCDSRLPRVAYVHRHYLRRSPDADVQDAVPLDDRLGLAGPCGTEVLRRSWIGYVNQLHAVLAAGDEQHIPRLADPGSELDRVVATNQLWFRGVGNVNDKQPILARGDIRQSRLHHNLPHVPQPVEPPHGVWPARFSDVQHVQHLVADRVGMIAFDCHVHRRADSHIERISKRWPETRRVGEHVGMRLAVRKSMQGHGREQVVRFRGGDLFQVDRRQYVPNRRQVVTNQLVAFAHQHQVITAEWEADVSQRERSVPIVEHFWAEPVPRLFRAVQIGIAPFVPPGQLLPTLPTVIREVERSGEVAVELHSCDLGE